MESLEKLYLLFSTDGLYYLLPVSKMDKILDGRQIPDDMETVDLSKITGGRSCTEGPVSRYTVLLKREKGILGLLVENIAGMTEAKDLIPLPEHALNRRNRFLKAVVRIKEENAVWAYVLDPDLIGSAPEAEAEQSGFIRGARTGTLPASTYIQLEYKRRQLYVDRQKVAVVVSSPMIQRVPCADETVLGLGEYKGKIVVYYNPEEKADTGQAGVKKYTCGIVLKPERDTFTGIPCDMVGAQEEFLEDLAPVINGVGAKRCD